MAMIGELVVGIIGDMSKLATTLNSASSSVSAFGKKVQETGKEVTKTGTELTKLVTGPIVAVGAGLLLLVNKTASWADSLMDLETQTGLTTDSLQEWRHVAEMAGTGADIVATAIMGLTRRLPDLQEEGSMSAEQLGKLGLTFADLEAMEPEEIANTLIERLAEMEDVIARNAIGAKLFGGAWVELAPILDLGAAGIAEARKEAYELGLVMSPVELENLDRYRKEWVKVKEQFAAVFRELATNLIPVFRSQLIPVLRDTLIPALTRLAKGIADVITWFGNLDPNVQKAILAAIAFAAAIGPLLVVIGNMTQAIGLAIQAFGGLQAAMAFLVANPIVLGVAAAAAGVVGLALAVRESGERAAEAQLANEAYAEAMYDLAYAFEDAEEGLVDLNEVVDANIKQIMSRVSQLQASTGEFTIVDTYELERQLEEAKALLADVPVEEAREAWKGAVDAILDEWTKIRPGMAEVKADLATAWQEATSVPSNADVWARVNELRAIGDAYAQELKDLAATTQAEMAAMGAQAAQAVKVAQGYTPAFEELEKRFIVVSSELANAQMRFGENSIEFAAALKELMTLKGEIESLMAEVRETATGDDMFSGWNEALTDLYLRLMTMPQVMDRMVEAEQKAAAAALEEARALREQRIEAELLAAQQERNAKLNQLSADRLNELARVYELKTQVTAAYEAKLADLATRLRYATDGSLEHATAIADLNRVYAELVSIYDTLTEAGVPIEAGFERLFGYAKMLGAELRDNVIPAVEDTGDAMGEAGDEALTWAEKMDEWLGNVIQGIKDFLAQSVLDILSFHRTLQAAEREHLDRMKAIREDFDRQEESASRSNERRIEDAQRSLGRKLEDLEREYRNKLLTIAATDFEARRNAEAEYQTAVEEANRDHSQALEDIQIDYSRTVEDLTLNRQAAATAELEAYEENRPRLIDTFKQTWEGIRDAIVQSGVKSLIDGIVDRMLGMGPAAEEGLTGLAAALTAMGPAAEEGLTGLAAALTAAVRPVASASAQVVGAMLPLIAALGVIALIMDFVTGGSVTAALNRWITENVLGQQHYGAGTWQEESLPSYDKGGIVSGALGEPQLAVVHGGEPIGAAGFAEAMDYGRFADAVAAGVYEAMSEMERIGGREIILQMDSRRLAQAAYPAFIAEKRRLGVEAV